MKVRGYKRVLNGVAAVERWGIGLLLLMDIAISAANVFSRYVIHQSWSFAEEVVVAALVLMSLVGAALCARDRGGLINLTLFADKLPRRTRLAVEIVMALGMVAFALVMVYYGIVRCADQIATNRLTAALRIPEWYYSAFVPIGGVLLATHSLERVADCTFEIVDGKEEEGLET